MHIVILCFWLYCITKKSDSVIPLSQRFIMLCLRLHCTTNSIITYISKVYKITVYINYTHSSYRVTSFLFVVKLEKKIFINTMNIRWLMMSQCNMIPGLDKPKTRKFLFAASLLYACSFKEKEQRLIISVRSETMCLLVECCFSKPITP